MKLFSEKGNLRIRFGGIYFLSMRKNYYVVRLMQDEIIGECSVMEFKREGSFNKEEVCIYIGQFYLNVEQNEG